MKTTTATLCKLKGTRPIVAVTAYDFITAQLADAAGVDLILVGDSLGNTVLGHSSTVPVTVEVMLHHTKAVARAQPQALLMADVPFAVAGHSRDYLLDSCARLLQEGGAEAVKIEGGIRRAENASVLTRAGIPVMGHIGLKPQDVLQLGGYRKFGKSADERAQLIAEAHAWEEAGAFALLMEMVEPSVAAEITEGISLPTVGIGAGSGVSGQILVISDLLGLNSGKYPGFAKRYAELRETAIDALKTYREEVTGGQFPK